MNKYYILLGEIRKFNQLRTRGWLAKFSLILWPLLILSSTYYTYLSFTNDIYSKTYFAYIVIGYMGFNLFWTIIQTSWQSTIERMNGILDIIFIYPCNKTLLMIGRSLGAIGDVLILLIIYGTIIIYFMGIESIGKLFVVYLVLILSAIIAGLIFNILFLFSRDTNFLFALLNQPMEFFSGVKLPIELLPVWVNVISLIFPLTYSLKIARAILFNGSVSIFMIASFVIYNLLLIIVTVVSIKVLLKRIRINGNFLY